MFSKTHIRHLAIRSHLSVNYNVSKFMFSKTQALSDVFKYNQSKPNSIHLNTDHVIRISEAHMKRRLYQPYSILNKGGTLDRY